MSKVDYQFNQEMTCQPIPINDLSTYKQILSIFSQLQPKIEVLAIHQYYDNSEIEGRLYDVYQITSSTQLFVLKKSNMNEVTVYNTFLNTKNFAVPKMFGYIKKEENIWILLEHIEGSDLKKFNHAMALSCAKNLVEIFNTYWQDKDFETNKLDNRFEQYFERICRRAHCLKDFDKLSKAYNIFLARQKECPRTLCNGDLLQCNALNSPKGVVIIDWGFAGIMPYALDIARLIAHGADQDDPFYMTDELREVFLSAVYSGLKNTSLTYEQFLWDVKLARLNECIEFIESNLNHPDKDKDRYFEYYFVRANKLSDEILEAYQKN